MEGHYVGLRLKDTGGRWNSTFAEQAICIDSARDPPDVVLNDGMKLTLLSPDLAALKDLRAHWSRAITRTGVDPADEPAIRKKLENDKRYRAAGRSRLTVDEIRNLAAIASQLDDSVANGSSIAFIAEYEGKRCAFLADAHMPVIESSIRRLAQRYGEARLRLDAVKVSHHGSKGNTTRAFLNLIDCPRFLISTDGSKFGHPDDEAVAHMVELGSKPTTRLYFNYRSAALRWGGAAQQRLNFRTKYPERGAGIAVDLLNEAPF